MEKENPIQVKFTSVKECHAYLNTIGYKISKPSIYRHIADGKLNAGPWLSSDLARYAELNLKQAGSRVEVGRFPQGQQAAADRKMAAQAEHWEIKTKIMRGEYVERVAFERGLAQRALVFKNDIENFVRNYAGEMVALVAGDASRVPDLINFWLDESEKWLHRYSEDREFKVPSSVNFTNKETAK